MVSEESRDLVMDELLQTLMMMVKLIDLLFEGEL